MSKIKQMLVMALLPLCACAKETRCLACLKKYTTHAPAKMPANTPAKMSANAQNYYPEVSRVRVCEVHKIAMCPICQSDDYAQRRVCNVVSGALKRLGLKKSMSFLEYLGADSWSQVLRYLAFKREAWNALHPDVPMTLTNAALDHIRPVSSFKQNSVGAQTLMCNHYTNLQPLLHADNSWKGEFWSLEDEKYWHSNIIMKPFFKHINYPVSAPSQPSLLRAPNSQTVCTK